MEIIKTSLKDRPCREHPDVKCDYVCLVENAIDRVVCIKCVYRKKIPLQELILISSVLEANENKILEAFPPLRDLSLFGELRDANFEKQIEKIEVFFKKLQEDFEKEVKAAEKRAKEVLIKQEESWLELLEGYMRIAEVKKFKQLIVSEKESAEKDLDDFIKEKWSKADENSQIFTNLIKCYEADYKFSLQEPNEIASELLSSLKDLNFFQKSIQQELEITLIESTRNIPQQMEITKIYNTIYQAKLLDNRYGSGTVFIDPIIDPMKKYILNIELLTEFNPKYREDNHYFFGLIKDKTKDDVPPFRQYLCYCEQSNQFVLTNNFKDDRMQSNQYEMRKSSYEVRIDLNERILRVASLPGYSSVAELDNPNQISPVEAYRFFICLLQKGDMMRITSIRTVQQFDKKM